MNHAVHATEQADIHRLPPAHVAIRQLWPVEKDRLFRHYKRLHPDDLRLRFGSAVSDEWLAGYAHTALNGPTVVKGAIADGRLVGVAEAWFSKPPHRNAEAAFSLERSQQGLGVGHLLFSAILRAARNRGAERLHMICMRDNPRMIALARAHAAEISVSPDGVTGEITGSEVKPYAVSAEFMNESLAYWLTVPLWAFSGIRGEIGK